MTKRSGKIKNPDQDPNLASYDIVRRVTGGETPAERQARVEADQRRLPTRILDQLSPKAKKRPPKR